MTKHLPGIVAPVTGPKEPRMEMRLGPRWHRIGPGRWQHDETGRIVEDAAEVAREAIVQAAAAYVAVVKRGGYAPIVGPEVQRAYAALEAAVEGLDSADRQGLGDNA